MIQDWALDADTTDPRSEGVLQKVFNRKLTYEERIACPAYSCMWWKECMGGVADFFGIDQTKPISHVRNGKYDPDSTNYIRSFAEVYARFGSVRGEPLQPEDGGDGGDGRGSGSGGGKRKQGSKKGKGKAVEDSEKTQEQPEDGNGGGGGKSTKGKGKAAEDSEETQEQPEDGDGGGGGKSTKGKGKAVEDSSINKGKGKAGKRKPTEVSTPPPSKRSRR